ncbi:uncharacterized protein LOC120666248 [Panicum virgatum]|uniref:Uncharacterized protein n=1 Tax=Panicum virgatum TaxID=38727 RepID=A0A8T0UG40_PANVG|nr:uncharacterized protein LOC120666248 [Panicum virgatum]KAG2620945.1 hypothetical protein PVAP13_3NG232200 [Panicum virgatum]
MTVGLALLLDLTSRLPRAGASPAAHSHAGLSAAAVAATAAAAFSSTGVPLSARHLFGFPGFTVAHCDAGTTAGWNGAPELINYLNTKILDSIKQAGTDHFQYPTKEYPSELKPLFSAFGLKNFTITTLRSFLLYYLPLIQPKPHTDTDDEDEDLLQDAPEEKVDLVTPFHNSVKQIMRETSIVTTRQVLERIVVRHVSQRTAWKLLKDASKSAKRKAARGMSTPQYTFCVARTTFRAHALGVAAAWVVQSIIEVYRCFIRKPSDETLPSDDDEQFDDMDKFRLFGRKVYGITIKSCFSLVLASVGAGIGALLHPVHGQWFGCALGDVAGPVVAIIVFEKMQLPL